MFAVALALAGFFAFVMLRVSQPAMGVLYTDLPFSDTTTIVKELEAKGIRYETRQDGQTILVARADIPKLRMDFAGRGLPTGGGVGYEIFDKGDAFSSTSFVQNINHLRALEGELARSIRSLSRVQGARVHLVIPERRLFERDREQPRASIVLRLRGELDPAQVRAVRNLVASAVEGLKPDRVSIVDESGRLLADGTGDGEAAVLAEERRTGVERRMKRHVEEIVGSIVGQGRARVQVAAEIDLNRVQKTDESFDPESKVLRSSQSRSEAAQTANDREGQVSVGNELPGNQRGAQAQNTARDTSNKNEEINNFDYSRTTRTEIQEAGRIKRLSVAVLVDGTYAKGGSGDGYQPRSQEELDRIAALVRSAIGFDKDRGDQVEIVNLRFAEAPKPVEMEEPSGLMAMLSFSREDLLRAAELGVLAILTLIVTLVVVRPLVGRIVGGDPVARKGMPAMIAAGAGEAGSPFHVPESAAAKYIELAQVNGAVQAQSLERIGEVVKGNPQETLAILRHWIHQGS